MADPRDKRRKRSGEKTSQQELASEIKQAYDAGADDLIAANKSVRDLGLPNRIDAEEYFGDFYDDIQPGVKNLRGTLGRTLLFNSKTYDRERNNQDVILFDKQSRTFPAFQYESPVITNFNSRGAIIIVNALDINVLTDDFNIIVEGLEPGSGNWYNILVSPSLTVSQLYIFKIYPGLNPILGFVTNDILPRNWRVVVRHNTVVAMNYGISGSQIL